jgi:uncharacterized membrane protein
VAGISRCFRCADSPIAGGWLVLPSCLYGDTMLTLLWLVGWRVQLLQSIMGPMNLMDNPLFKKYILKSTDRVWGEALEG